MVDTLPTGKGFGAMTTYWDADCGKKRLVGADLDFTDKIVHLYTYDEDSRALQEICAFTLPVLNSPRNHRHLIYGLTSTDEFRDNCRLRLDLDVDNSSGRFIDHFQADTVCTLSYPVSDGDVALRSDLGPIDSLVLRLAAGLRNPGGEGLTAPPDARFTFSGLGTPRLTVRNAGAATTADFADLLRRVRLEFSPDNLQGGERRVYCRIYAAGDSSDLAKAFIDVDLDYRLSAGRDTMVTVCFQQAGKDLFRLLGPAARAGGRWEPGLVGGGNFFHAGLDTSGLYRYIVQEGGCAPDTAEVRVERLEPPPIGFPTPNLVNVVHICPGDTLVWRLPPKPANALYLRWTDGFPDPVRDVSLPGIYNVEMETTEGCYWLAKTLVNARPEGPRTSERQTSCVGQAVEWDGLYITSDTTVCRSYPLVNSCDSVHCVTITFEPLPQRADTVRICAGETYQIGEEELSEAGTYRLRRPAALGCDTLLDLTLLVDPAWEVRLDTSITAGGEVVIAGRRFSEPGEYVIELEDENGCTGTILLHLTVIDALSDPARLGLRIPTLLTPGADRWAVYTTDGRALLIDEVVIHDGWGRPVYRVAHLLANDGQAGWRSSGAPPGLYYYRLRFREGGREQSLVGKVVVVR